MASSTRWSPAFSPASNPLRRDRRRICIPGRNSGQIDPAVSLSRQFEDIVVAAELSNTDDEHDPEGTTIAFERAPVSALLSQALLDLEL